MSIVVIKTVVAHLVTIAPLVVLGADVLVRVLGALLQRRHVAPVVPVLNPEVIGVGTGNGEGGDNTALRLLANWSPYTNVAQVNVEE